jgi:transforming growth factor-beta-induced protein
MKSIVHFPLLVAALVSTACSSASKKPAEEAVYVKAPASSTMTLAESGSAGQLQIMGLALATSSHFEKVMDGAPFTILAVKDEQFASLPAEWAQALGPRELDALVGFHVLPGRLTAEQLSQFTRLETIGGQRLQITNWNGELEISGPSNKALGLPPARIVARNIQVGNGLVHLLDGLAGAATQDLYTTVGSSTILTQLVFAAELAGVAGILTSDGPLTLFAPSDAAFESLEPGTVARLLEPANQEELLRVLRRHIVPGRLYADRFHTGTMVGFGGDQMEFTWRGGDFYVQGARIVHTDVEATNGVIHVIDRVLVD